jgi:hypothetical protein
MSEIIETDSPDPADIADIAGGLRAYNTAMARYDDYRSPMPGDRTIRLATELAGCPTVAARRSQPNLKNDG